MRPGEERSMKPRFSRGDRVELPQRLRKNGGKEGVVVYSSFVVGGESVTVARFVNGNQRDTVVSADELYRLPGRLEEPAAPRPPSPPGLNTQAGSEPAGSSSRLVEQIALGVPF